MGFIQPLATSILSSSTGCIYVTQTIDESYIVRVVLETSSGCQYIATILCINTAIHINVITNFLYIGNYCR